MRNCTTQTRLWDINKTTEAPCEDSSGSLNAALTLRAVWAGCGMCAHADAPGGLVVPNACVDSETCAIL